MILKKKLTFFACFSSQPSVMSGSAGQVEHGASSQSLYQSAQQPAQGKT